MQHIVRSLIAACLVFLLAGPLTAAKLPQPARYGFDDNAQCGAAKATTPHLRAVISKAFTRTVIDTVLNIRSILGTNCRSIE
ncbi:MAG TPA: hypothetical protein VMF29_09690, partial [Candidatus Edwardsbacteria bacterium]|nr:hypothetical protein [Candidatus Edwardsbacteria bacterium]